ncbi:MAG: Dihydrolipoyllysine-residue acetyltransferase component of pyruvate dehydrogenase complex [Firmicutes bacterium ADurb.Bin193]|nr:MAG: Dihydrolipoyllysine-residue acetyltransferase component of pyruvate dehydrogenase complex [Firmicutes bacterium ADurb.Bin193]
MATPIIMPKQGQSVESCIITKWNKKVGDSVSVGDVLFSYETDKASFEEESKVEGKMLAIFFDEGDDVECLTNVCVIGQEGEDFSVYAPNSEAEKEPPAEVKEAVAEEVKPATIEIQPVSQDGGIKISPRARNLAEKSGVDIKQIAPTGPMGRIIERDVQGAIAEGKLVTVGAKEQYSKSSFAVSGTGIGGRVTTADLSSPQAQSVLASTSQYDEVKLSNIRKLIAKSMHASLSNSAQLTLNSSFDAGDILSFRKKLKENAEAAGNINITITDIIVWAVSRALMKHREFNAHFMGDTMRLFNTANVGIACDTPRGLMVPTLFGADRLSLAEISNSSKALTGACREGTISPDLLTGGTFTVTNLGTLGVESFTPVLNPPQTGILGVCALTERTKNGVPYSAMGLSLTFDHRAVDGAPAARFLQEVVHILENFSITLALTGGIF